MLCTANISASAEPRFSYKYGGFSDPDSGNFNIWREDGKTYFESYSMFGNDVFAEADAGIFDELSEIIKDSGSDKWDGYSEYTEGVLDGYGFNLSFEYGDESVNAHGYDCTPENYETAHKVLSEFLTEYAKGLSMSVPSAEAVSLVSFNAGDFEFIIDYSGSSVTSLKIYWEQSDEVEFVSSTGFWPFPAYEAYRNEKGHALILRDEPGRQLREKLLELELLDAVAENNKSYAQLQFHGVKYTGDHVLRVAVTPEDENWLTGRVLEILRLPENYDLNLLFENSEAGYTPPESEEAPEPAEPTKPAIPPSSEKNAESGAPGKKIIVLNESDEPGYFNFNYGYFGDWSDWGGNEGNGRFSVWTDDDGVTYFFANANADGEQIRAFGPVEPDLFKEVFAVLKENKMEAWDGFYKYTEAESGRHFSLTAGYGKDFVQAYGYEYFPENYQAGHEALRDFLIARAKELSLFIPPAEWARYVNVRAGEYEIRLGYHMSVKNRPRVSDVKILKEGVGNNYSVRAEHDEPDVLLMEPAYEMIEKVLSLELSMEFVPADSAVDYASVECDAGGSDLGHSLYAVLTEEEREWFLEKVRETLGLSKDYDLGLLFEKTAR